MNTEWTSNSDSQVSRLQPPGRTCPTCSLNVDASIEKCPRDGTVLADLTLAERLFEGRYQILSVIASGGMGTIYKAVQRALGKTVAIKMLKTQENSHTMWARFKQEAKTASLLNHPNIIQVYDFGATLDGQPFMVMDYIDGTDLGALIKSEGKLKPFEAITIFSQVCDAMEHAHTKGILHRDLKPSNVMLTNLTGVPEVKIVDFGIAKFIKGGDTQALTQTGEIFGSPYYMSPEQTTGKSVDHRSDIYSVGCIMYETLSGSVPIAGNTAFETLMKHMTEKPVPVGERCPKDNLSPELQRVVMKSLEKEQSKRFQTMAELRDALAEVPEARGKARPGAGGKAGLSPKKILLATICGILLLGVIIGVIVFSIGHRDAATDLAEVQPVKLLTETEKRHKADTNFAADEDTATQKKDPITKPSLKPKVMPKLQEPVMLRGLDDTMLAEFVRINKDATSVALRDCSVTDTGVQVLNNLNLAAFACESCGKVKEKGLVAIIEHQPYLQALQLNHLTGSKKVAQAIGKLQYLTTLALNDVHGLNLDDLGGNLPLSLQDLSLEYYQRVPPHCLLPLTKLTNLTTLSLANSLVSNTRLAEVTKLSNLKILNIDGCPITDEGLAEVLKFKKLARLSLRRTFISPDGFMKLTNLPALMELNVADVTCKLTGKDYDAFLHKHYCTITPYVTRAQGFLNGTVFPDEK